MTTVVESSQIRIYERRGAITFRKTNERFGGLSNMAGGYPLNVNGVKILTSEALYQACRFPLLPEVQRQIIAERSPMSAKMKSKPYRNQSRPDWDNVRIKIMRWCLQVKLVQNWDKFSELLLETGDLPIVEESSKDDFWGAKPKDELILIGANALGRLLMELREQVKNGEITSQSIIKPLSISDFLLYGQEINLVSKDSEYCEANSNNLLECKKTSIHLDSNLINSDLILINVPEHKSDSNDRNSLSHDLEKYSVERSQLEFNKYDSLQFILPHIVECLQEAELSDKELAKIFRTNLAQMRQWLKRAMQLGKIRKISKPVRYIAESQLSLIC